MINTYASSACYNDDTKKGYDLNGSSPFNTDYRSETCKSTNWLLDTSNWFWTVSPSSNGSSYAMGVYNTGNVTAGDTSYSSSLRQSVYLDTIINYVGGSGTIDDPYIIEN